MTRLLKERNQNHLPRMNARAVLALVLLSLRWLARWFVSAIGATAKRSRCRSTGSSVFIHHGVALCALGLLAVAAGRAHSDDDVDKRAGAQPTALVVWATNAPLSVEGSDGLTHLEYDLIVTNAFTTPVTLTSIEVLTPHGPKLLQLSGDALGAVTGPMLATNTEDQPTRQVPASGAVAVVIDVVVPTGQVPKRLTHRITYEVPADAPALALIGSYEIAGPELVVERQRPIVISPPLRGAGWFSLNGCCRPNAHRSLRYAVDGRRITKAEMFAIDWVQLRGGFFFSGDGSRNEQYPYFGADVLAVADGTVVLVRDDMPEETPGLPPLHVKAPIDFAGNQVVLQISPDVWAVYAHLQPGSARVQVGDRVTVGQALARLGNSGNTNAPHLHFVLTDHPNFVIAKSVPFVLDRYTLAGFVTPEALKEAFSGPVPRPIAISGSPRSQRHTHPLVLSVTDFLTRHDGWQRPDEPGNDR